MVPALVDDFLKFLVGFGSELEVEVGKLRDNAVERAEGLMGISAHDGRDFFNGFVFRFRQKAFQELKRKIDWEFVAQDGINQFKIVRRIVNEESSFAITGRAASRKGHAVGFEPIDKLVFV